ncbi:MAG: hypothetical protein Q9176_001377 [Flavoplaca citrina]
MRWPFLKSKLKVPRAELMRIKVDLTLLFTSAMVIEASSATEKAKSIKNVPGLTRAKERATSEAEQAKKRAVKRGRGPRLSGQDGERTEPDPEVLQQFIEFQEKRMQEEEDKRLNLLLLEKEAQKKAAEQTERKLEVKILRKYNAKQAEIQNRNAEKKEALRKELETAGIEPGRDNKKSQHNEPFPNLTSPKSTREINTERGRSHARELLRSRMGRESEDEKKGSGRIPPKQSSSEDKPNDEETILRTVRRFTTFKADATPTDALANPNISASTPFSSSPKEVEVRASEAQTGQLHRYPVNQHSYMPLASAAPGLPRQVPLLTYEILEPGQSKGPDEEQLETGHISGSPERYPSAMEDEPPEITAEDGSNATFALDASRRHIEAAQQDPRSHIAFGESTSDDNNLYYRDSEPATPSDEAEKRTTSPERVPQVHEDRDLTQPNAESNSEVKLSRRYTTVEEDSPEK